jgi:NAD-dependent deacetylase
MNLYKEVADLIKISKHSLAFTGAGISVESGIPTFRGSQGLWSKYDPEEFAHIDSFIRILLRFGK